MKGVQELHTYVERNQQFLPNYGERYRNGERIASGFVESAVNQVLSKRVGGDVSTLVSRLPATNRRTIGPESCMTPGIECSPIWHVAEAVRNPFNHAGFSIALTRYVC